MQSKWLVKSATSIALVAIMAVETALTGRTIANGTSMAAKIRSSRKEGSILSAAEKPSSEKPTELMKLRKPRRLKMEGSIGSGTMRESRRPTGVEEA